MCLEVLLKAQTSCSACIKVVSAVQTTGLKIQFVCSISQISVVVTGLIGVQKDKQVSLVFLLHWSSICVD